MNKVRVNLTKRDQRPGVALGRRAQFSEKGRTIALNRVAGILFCETEIESVPPITAGKTASPCAETMNEPRNPLQRFNSKDVKRRFLRGLGRHINILKDATDQTPDPDCHTVSEVEPADRIAG